MTRRLVRFVIAVATVVGTLLLAATPASADPPGPTDYESRVVSITPSTDAISVAFIGGDSFVELTVAAGHEVIVLGYNGDPYLRFDADGSVWENDASPTRYLNEDRFGAADVPAEADPQADPRWRRVGSGGRYAWHDHRTHWMNEARPPAASPGDQILEAAVPLRVDGVDVQIVVASFWLPGPGSVTTALVAGAAVVGLVAVAFARGAVRWGLAVVAGAGALGLGLAAYRAVPAETGPPRSLWLLPLIVLVAAAVAVASRRRVTVAAAVVRASLGFLVGADLLLWAFSRRDAVGAAIIPSSAPHLLDRFGIALVGAVGLGFAVMALLELFAPDGWTARITPERLPPR